MHELVISPEGVYVKGGLADKLRLEPTDVWQRIYPNEVVSLIWEGDQLTVDVELEDGEYTTHGQIKTRSVYPLSMAHGILPMTLVQVYRNTLVNPRFVEPLGAGEKPGIIVNQYKGYAPYAVYKAGYSKYAHIGVSRECKAALDAALALRGVKP